MFELYLLTGESPTPKCGKARCIIMQQQQFLSGEHHAGAVQTHMPLLQKRVFVLSSQANLLSGKPEAMQGHAENRTSEEQYDYLDGNLRRFLNKLRNRNDDRKHLRLGDLVELWNRQDGRCAITGIEMTYRAALGSFFPYNVSIDRIVPKWEGGTYALNNIQLVCKMANELKKHYCVSDARQSIREFAERVIAGQECQVGVRMPDGTEEQATSSQATEGLSYG